MTKENREELERIIHQTREWQALHLEVRAEILENVKKGIVQAILSVGYVKKDSIELDEEKIKSIIMLSEIGQWARAWKIGSNYSSMEWDGMCEDYNKLVDAIATQIKELVRWG